MKIIDTHCHLHDSEFYHNNKEDIYKDSIEAGVFMICVGTDMKSSREAVEFAKTHDNVMAVVGVHPHEAKHGCEGLEALIEDNHKYIVGVGEIGLDYFYEHSPRDVQTDVLKTQLRIAQKFRLPVSFHVREAYTDFWPIYDEFSGQAGVLHSYTDSIENYRMAAERGLYVGINGISTFTRDTSQQRLFAEIPLESIVLETDAPFLTPSPFRGKMNSPAHVGRVAEHQAMLKQVSLDVVLDITNRNARQLFNLS